MTEMDRRIMAQTAFKVAGWIHAAEVTGGAEPDIGHLAKMAKEIATGMKLLSGESSGGPSTAEAGGPPTTPGPSVGDRDRPSSPAPSCPKCNEPMEFNQKSVGTNKPTWRCSQRGRFVLESKSWTGCDGVRWEDAA